MNAEENLIVLSNRLPFTLVKSADGLQRKPSAGGLVTAVAPVVVASGGMWVGWPGEAYSPDDKVPEAAPSDTSITAGLKSDQIVPVFLTPQEHEEYYNGFCNGSLWPIFHSMPDRAVFVKEHWEAYVEVNRKFARSAVEAIKKWTIKNPDKSPVVWIQDYHLMLAANFIQNQLIDDGVTTEPTCAFFLHIPMPSYDILKVVPWENEIIKGMLGCEIIGFHIKDYCKNFLECCQSSLGLAVDREQMLVENLDSRYIMVKPLPISIPFDEFEKLAKMNQKVKKVKSDTQVILGVDRLDYTKGLLSRMRSYARLLKEYPEHIGKVTLIQVAVPSRTDVPEYKELKEDMDQLVGEINGQFSTSMWSPILYIYGMLPHAELAGLYRDAEIGMITPMRDGMNLVAKEFVACRVNRPGVLILSPFAGAGEQLEEALLVNPYEETNVAAALHRALTMEESEKKTRMDRLRERVKEQDINHWVKMFFDAVNSYRETLPSLMEAASCEKDFEAALTTTFEKEKLAIFLDYDGTLAPIMTRPEQVQTPIIIRRLLKRLSSHPNVYIAIVSGRDVDDVQNKIQLDGLTYAGNHGGSIRLRSGKKYDQTASSGALQELSNLETKMNALRNKYCGSWIENKGELMCVHYRSVDQKKQNEFAKKVNAIIQTSQYYEAKPAHSAIECKPKGAADKGTAVKYIMEQEFGKNWEKKVAPIFIGDDVTDEDAIRQVNLSKGSTFRVTHFKDDVTTEATQKLDDQKSVIKLLRWIDEKIEKTNK